MFGRDDTSYDDIRDRSIEAWLRDMATHDDLEVRGGVRVTQAFIEDLKRKIQQLENKNALKDKYLRQMREKIE